MAAILGYWDIRGVSEGAAGLGGKEMNGGRKCCAVDTNTTRMFLLRTGCSSVLFSGLSFSGGPVSESPVCVWRGGVGGVAWGGGRQQGDEEAVRMNVCARARGWGPWRLGGYLQLLKAPSQDFHL